MENNLVSEKQKEMCAVSTIRRMVEIFSEKNHVPYNEAFLNFAASNTYKAIFDFDTGIWKEGPLYFLSLYEEEL